MWRLSAGQNTGKIALRVFAVMILYVCISTVADIAPIGESYYHGLDVLTISGDRSSIEIFSVGGVYVLHDYSMIAPGCNLCQPVDFQVDHGLSLGSQSVELGSRIVPHTFELATSTVIGYSACYGEPAVLVSWCGELDSPPPRSF